MEIGLVLSGGGARGLAHIGVIKALEEKAVKPVAIAGCSMGGIIGACYGAGYSAKQMQDITKKVKYASFLHFGEHGGLIGSKGIAKLFSKYLPENFSDLDVTLSVTSVDVQSGSIVIFNKGELIPALCATSALPGFLSPMHYQDRYLIDGGLLNNLPVDIIRTMTLAPVIAVDIAAPPNRKLAFEDKDKPNMFQSLNKIITGKSNVIDELFQRGLTMELFMKSFDVPQSVMTEMRLSLQPPELLIRPELDSQFGVEDFHRGDEAIDIGYEAAKTALAEFLE